MTILTESALQGEERRAAPHRMIWRWHFYAGLFCIPFVICLASTGSIYLFRPQIEAWLDQPYRHLAMDAPPARASTQVAAALAAVPGAVLASYQLPSAVDDAAQVLVQRGGVAWRVYVHPSSAEVLKVVQEEKRPMRVLAHLHGELLLGDKGSMLVELAASWAIVMLLTGLYLWWPRDARGLGGILYPRLRSRERVFWRDLHGVTAFWISGLALFLLVSGLPWAKSWGSLLKEVRQWGTEAVVSVDWPVGASANEAQAASHAGHVGHAPAIAFNPLDPDAASAMDHAASAARSLRLEPPVLVSPAAHGHWMAKSDAANRLLRADVLLDSHGEVAERTSFSQHPLIDRIVGYGVAAHEGQLFGALNQALGVTTAIGLILVCISALKLWWSRRPRGRLGAPASSPQSGPPLAMIGLIAALGILLPFLGITAITVAIAERFVLFRIPPVAKFLGLVARA